MSVDNSPVDTRTMSADVPAGYFAALKRVAATAQKSGRGVPAYTRWINRPTARFVVAAAHVCKLTPNALTVVSALCSAIAMLVLLTRNPDWGTGLAVAVLLAIGYLLDSADGQLARLQGSGGIAGEWLDHVVDAIRTPAIHLAVLVALFTQTALPTSYAVLPLLFCLISVGHFMSQILAEKLLAAASADKLVGLADRRGAGYLRSFAFLPADTGVLCWTFILWGSPGVFAIAYGLLCAGNLVIASISIRNKYTSLRKMQRKLGGKS